MFYQKIEYLYHGPLRKHTHTIVQGIFMNNRINFLPCIDDDSEKGRSEDHKTILQCIRDLEDLLSKTEIIWV